MVECNKVKKNIEKPCVVEPGGVEDRVYVFDLDDVDRDATKAALDADNKVKLSDLVLKPGKKGFYVQGSRNSVIPDSVMSISGKFVQHLQTVRFTAFASDVDTKWELEKLNHNKYVIVFRNNDGEFEVGGLHTGMLVKEAPYTPADPATRRTRNIAMGNDEQIQEPYTFATLLKTDGATTLAYLESLMVVTPLITPDTLPGADTGEAYSEDLSVEGLTGTVTWSVASGALPTGLSLNSSTGTISGTPSAAGTFLFKVEATNGINTASETYSVVITTP